MKGTIYGNRLPGGTQVTTALDVNDSSNGSSCAQKRLTCNYPCGLCTKAFFVIHSVFIPCISCKQFFW
jgi:hypothetical protein